MKTILNGLNFAIAGTGISLAIRLLHTYGNPIPLGVLFVLLISAKCYVEVMRN